MKNLSAALLSVLATMFISPATAAPPVEMVTDTENLQPAGTLEFRFERPMIGRDEVGISEATEQAPVVIIPPLAGRFTWLSRSSGVLAPDEAWPLGKTFTITLRDGLTNADGKRLTGNFSRILRTPAFGPTVSRGGGGETCTPAPQIVIAYNLAVDAASAQGLFRFVNDQGGETAATVSHATRSHYLHVPIEHDDWQKRWRTARGMEPDEATQDRDAPIANRLVIQPVAPLTPGSWRLEMKPGLASQDGTQRISEPWTLKLGAVAPFDITTLRTENLIHSGRVLTIGFSQRLAPDITPETAARFLSFDPPVANLRFEGWSHTLIVRGNFEINREYRLLVGEDVISGDALPFAGERSRTFRFNPVNPRLYLPEITASQIQSGHRRFDVLSANLSELKVVARLVHPEDAAAAIEAFAKYERENADYENHEFYQPLPEYPFRSEPIAERVIATAAGPLDAKQVTAVDWNDLLGGRRTGVVFLTIEGEPRGEIGGKRPGAQALVQLTDLGVMWKKTDAGLQVTVFSMESGAPMENAAVTFLDKEFKTTTREVSTGKDGIATPPWMDQSEWLLVRKGDDTHALRIGMAAEELPMYGMDVPIAYKNWLSFGQKDRPMRSIIFTDRPLYRPGETVRVKGILRDVSDNGLLPAAGCKATLTLSDPRGRDVLNKEVITDARGAFDTEITVGTAAGSHMLKLEIPDVARSPYSTGFNCHFTVADFQPDAFELNVDVPERLAPGETAIAMVEARYLFGAPLDRADMRWTLIEREQYFNPDGYDNWSFRNGDESEQALTLRGETKLGGDKPHTITPQLPAAASPRRAQLTVEVTDINQQTVSSSVSFSRDPADFQLGAAFPAGRVARIGEEFPIQVIAVRPDGTPLENPTEITAELVHKRFETVRVKGAGNAISFRTETVKETIAKTTGRTLVPERENGLWLVKDGSSASFRIERNGGYDVKLTARDSAGREVVNVMPLYVSGEDEVAWDYRNPAQVDLVTDKQEYRPGETARVMVKSPISGEALVTIERGETILRRMHVKLEGNAPEIEVPLSAEDAPNVFVSLMLIRGREHSTLKHKMPSARYGLAMLRVRKPDERLIVEVKPVKAEVLPGGEVDVVVHVKNEAGNAVPDAEVVLFAPDDGILNITGYQRPRPDNIFHAPFPLAIRTWVTLFDLLPEDPGALDFSNKGYLIGGGGSGGPGMKARTDFPGTAAWFPQLRTDATGVARVKFTAPDALTRYRLVAVAHAGNHGFGTTESSFAIRQPLMILPGLGQHANVGDLLAARAVIRNESGKDGSVEVSLTLDATAEAVKPGALQQRVELKNGSSLAVDMPLRLIAMGDARWTWSARLDTGGETLIDETVSNLKVGSAAPLLRETYLTETAANSRTDLLAGVNPQLLEGAGDVVVTLSNTRLATLRESATQLLEYPYGCAEQIVSGLIPWILLDDIKPVMPKLADEQSDANAVIQKTLDHLFSMQTPDGGIAYWPGGQDSSLFASAYAAVACSLAERRSSTQLPAGHPALLDFLSAQLRSDAAKRGLVSHEDRALALFALSVSGRAEPAYHEKLYQLRKELSGEARAWLAMAIRGVGGPEKMIRTLLDPKVTSPDAASWFGGPARERAVQLLAWLMHQPQARETAKLVNELLAFRHNGHWDTTQSNAWALLVLSQYYAAVENGTPDMSATLVAADRRFPVSLDRHTITSSHELALTPGPLAAIHQSGGGKLFAEARFVVRPQVINQPAQNRGYAVSRTYQKLVGDGGLTDATDLKVGDRLVVTLRVETARPGHFVAIDDPLPAILEAVNPAFRSRAVGGGHQHDWVSDHRETRADRVLYFCDHLAPGTYTFRYLARVRMAGAAHAGPTKVEEMYRPERFGLGEAVMLTSQPAIER